MNVNPLGQQTDYVSVYSPQLLFPIARAESRKLLSAAAPLPFYGVDVWTGYELSWLDTLGKPVVAVVEFFIPCDSEFMIESKSFKLYLNSFNQTQFKSVSELEQVLVKDLSAVTGAAVLVNVYPALAAQPAHLMQVASLEGTVLDALPVAINSYHPDSSLLMVGDELVTERLVSHLLKTNCPVTGQPDWASVVICYTGNKILPESLLKYIVSFREHQDFHEHCIERIYSDIARVCQPQHLTVYARYTRRGGLDINPFRSSDKNAQPELLRLIRQ